MSEPGFTDAMKDGLSYSTCGGCRGIHSREFEFVTPPLCASGFNISRITEVWNPHLTPFFFLTKVQEILNCSAKTFLSVIFSKVERNELIDAMYEINDDCVKIRLIFHNCAPEAITGRFLLLFRFVLIIFIVPG